MFDIIKKGSWMLDAGYWNNGVVEYWSIVKEREICGVSIFPLLQHSNTPIWR
jgi:hypothetical protein